MTWQDAGVIVVVGSAIAYLVRKFLLPARPRAKAAAFISVQQLKSGPQAKSNTR